MDIEQIKQLIQTDKAKIIIMEEGKPVLVILSFEDYQKILPKKKGRVLDNDPENEHNDKQIVSQQASNREKNFQSQNEQAASDLTIDDLPF